ncbi:TolC family protein [Niveibacterium terrae]|uniref:TolC family protein n=1 Tax=Niveibacterium terrae TaxID=3373598 RepID=UPI003A95C1CF
MLDQTLSRMASSVVLCTVLFAVAGCASVTPASAIADASARHQPRHLLSPAASDAGLRLGAPSREWWRELNDPQLDALVQRAMASNHDRLAALAAVREARVLAGAAERAGLPQGSLNAGAQSVRPSIAEADPYKQGLPRAPEQRLANIDQRVSWEIDLFGRIGTAAAVAEREADATEADAHACAALLQAEVVRRYVLLRLNQINARRLGSELALLRQRQSLLDARVQAGVTDRREAIAGLADLAGAEAEQAATGAAIERERAALAVLAGRSPTRSNPGWEALLAPADLPAVPVDAQLAQPDDLLANRPDVVRADALLRAAMGGTVLAERAHLPHLNLNLSAGLNAAFGSLGQVGALRYAVGPALQWDWLDGGRKRLRAEAARAGQERVWHQFEQTVLRALEDSENSLRDWIAAQAALRAAQEAESASRRTSGYTAARVAAGMEAPGAALDTRLAHSRQQRSLGVRQAEALQAFAQVQLSLAAWKP